MRTLMFLLLAPGAVWAADDPSVTVPVTDAGGQVVAYRTTMTRADQGTTIVETAVGVGGSGMTTQQLDAQGRVQTVSDRQGHVTTYTWNRDVGQIATVVFPDLATYQVAYGADGQVRSVTSPAGTVTPATTAVWQGRALVAGDPPQVLVPDPLAVPAP